MSDKRIIEVSSCENCPYLKETTQGSGLFYCPYDLNNFFRDGLNNVRKNCPLPKKEKIEDRTCRNCKHMVQVKDVGGCSKYGIGLILGEEIRESFINDNGKHCWEKKSE